MIESKSSDTKSTENGDPSDALEGDPEGGDGLGIPGGGDDPDGDGDGDDLPETCPDCGGDLLELPEDSPFKLENGIFGKTDEGDARCLECDALVTTDGEAHQ